MYPQIFFTVFPEPELLTSKQWSFFKQLPIFLLFEPSSTYFDYISNCKALLVYVNSCSVACEQVFMQIRGEKPDSRLCLEE